MATDKKLSSLVINTLTQAQYDSATKNEDELYLTPDDTDEQLANKQDKLVSGTNIKTVNGNSLLGSGDIEISGGSSNYEMHTFDMQVLNDSVSMYTLRLIVNGKQLDYIKNALMQQMSVSTWDECKSTIQTYWSAFDASTRISQLMLPLAQLLCYKGRVSTVYYMDLFDGGCFPCTILFDSSSIAYVIYASYPESFTSSQATGIKWLNVTTTLAKYNTLVIAIDD